METLCLVSFERHQQEASGAQRRKRIMGGGIDGEFYTGEARKEHGLEKLGEQRPEMGRAPESWKN